MERRVFFLFVFYYIFCCVSNCINTQCEVLCFNIVSENQAYLVLVDTPYPNDRVPASGEETIECWVELQCIYPISIVLLHLISNDVRHLRDKTPDEFIFFCIRI